MRKPHLRLLHIITFTLLIFSCKKNSPETFQPKDLNIYEEWLSNSETSYKDGFIKINLSENNQVTGFLNWSKMREFKWRGHDYVDIPYEFNNSLQIKDEVGSFHSFNLVIRKNTLKDWEAAIRTTKKEIRIRDDEEQIVEVQLYKDLTGQSINMWKKEGDGKAEPLFIYEPSTGSAQRMVCIREDYELYSTTCITILYRMECTQTKTLIPTYSCSYDTSGGGDNGGGDIIVFPPGEELPLISIISWNQAVVRHKPFVFFPHLSCSTITQWAGTANSQAGSGSISKINSIIAADNGIYKGGEGIKYEHRNRLLDFTANTSSVINMDFFGIKITTLPSIGGTPFTADGLMEYIRKNLNSFLDSSVAVFEPYNYGSVNDSALWHSSNPLNTVLSIDVPGADNAFAVVHHYTNSTLAISTMHDPRFGNLPVAGSRDIAYVQNTDGSYTFYTWGVDRVTQWLEETLYYVSLNGASSFSFSHTDAIWNSFRASLYNFVMSNGGAATLLPIETYRPNWSTVKDVVDEVELGGDVLNYTCNP